MYGGHKHCGSVFNISRDFTWPAVQRVLWFNGLNFLMKSHYLAKFSGHRLFGSRDTADEIFYIIKGFGDITERTSSLCISTLPKLIAIDIVLMVYNYFNFSRDLTRSRDYTVIRLYGLKSFKLSQHPATFCGNRHCGLEITWKSLEIFLKVWKFYKKYLKSPENSGKKLPIILEKRFSFVFLPSHEF